jgi:Concanavalin A-like lectin/glucanases superfamily
MSRTSRQLSGVVLALTMLLAGAPAAGAQSEWPLQGYWPFLEAKGQTIYDISGRGNHGKFGRLPGADPRDPAWIRGLFGVGSALRLDGNDFVAIPDTATLRPKTVTFEAWVRAKGSPGQWKYIGVKGGDRCEAGSFGLYTSINGGLAFYVYDGKKWWRSPQVGTDVWDGDWHHVAGTYDGANVRLFVDGYEIGSGRSFNGQIEYDLPHKELTIGAFRGACSLTFAGDVDEVRMWSAALPVSKIWNLISALLDHEPAAPLPEDAREWYDGG